MAKKKDEEVCWTLDTMQAHEKRAIESLSETERLAIRALAREQAFLIIDALDDVRKAEQEVRDATGKAHRRSRDVERLRANPDLGYLRVQDDLPGQS